VAAIFSESWMMGVDAVVSIALEEEEVSNLFFRRVGKVRLGGAAGGVSDWLLFAGVFLPYVSAFERPRPMIGQLCRLLFWQQRPGHCNFLDYQISIFGIGRLYAWINWVLFLFCSRMKFS
jgi:hypothetical protein